MALIRRRVKHIPQQMSIGRSRARDRILRLASFPAISAQQYMRTNLRTLINTTLQRGVRRAWDRGNRFNGFPACQFGWPSITMPLVPPCLLLRLVTSPDRRSAIGSEVSLRNLAGWSNDTGGRGTRMKPLKRFHRHRMRPHPAEAGC